MKKSLLIAVLFTIAFVNFSFGQMNQADVICRKWKTIDDETGKPKSVVEIYKQDGKYFGKITHLLNREKGDENPDCKECKGEMAKYKTADGKVIGVVFIRNLEYNAKKNKWEKGTIFDPAKGAEYKCEISLGGINLMVKGIHWTGLSRTQVWMMEK